MSFDINETKKVAHLARLGLDSKEEERLTKEISGILSWIDNLCKIDTDGVEPMFSVNKEKTPFRKDEVTDGNIAKDIVKNAPEAALNMFVVPKVVE